MIYGKKILWAINVYSRIDHLKQQQELLRHFFGNEITILVFCNKEGEDPRYKEDILVTSKVNSGHHTGVRDAHNANLKYLADYDFVISSHADCMMTDYSVVNRVIKELVDGNKKFAQLCSLEGYNVHMCVVQPHAFNDFFILDARAWEKMGEILDFCDAGEGIEGKLIKNVKRVVKDEEVYLIPCKDSFGNANPNSFIEVYGDKNVRILRENNMGNKVNFLRDHSKAIYDILKRAGLV